MNLVEPALITAKVTGVLEKLKVRYFIGGSLASTLFGMVRTTQDADIVAELSQEHVEEFVGQLISEFYIDKEMIVAAIDRRSSFNIIHRESIFKVDIFIPEMRPFMKAQLGRARRQILSIEPPSEAFFATPEDTLLAKLEWYRLGGEVSERQWRDVLGILGVQGDSLDFDYLRDWARELKVNDLLDRALKGSTL